MTTTAAPVPGLTIARERVRAILTRTALQTASVARRGAATTIGAAGLASGAIGAGAQWGWPVGLMVACPLAVWFASLLPSDTR